MLYWRASLTSRPIAMRDAFLDKICQEMARDDRIFFVSADFGSPVLDRIRAQYPKRFMNVGIAEQNLINLSAGLAIEGFKVFAYAIAPFITMRCYEQIRVNLALLSGVRALNVTLIGVGAGYSYVVSGPTHQCYEDLTLMRAMPNMVVYSPADHMTTAALFEHCVAVQGPKYLRLDAQVLPVIYETAPPQLYSGFHVHCKGKDLCLIATGYMLHTALKLLPRLTAQGLTVGLIDLYNLTHFSADLLETALTGYPQIVTLEEGFRGRGGMDAMLFDFVARRQLEASILNIGVEGGYRFELGSRSELHEQVGIGVNAAFTQIIAWHVRSRRSDLLLKESR